MKKIVMAVILAAVFVSKAGAQQVDTFYFNLYTDSLKKGTHNYINIDGKLSNGTWLPLTNKQLDFSAPSFAFEGNDLVIPADCRQEKITIRVTLKSDPSVFKEKTVWIKKLPDPDLPTKEEVLRRRN